MGTVLRLPLQALLSALAYSQQTWPFRHIESLDGRKEVMVVPQVGQLAEDEY
jgi:hypothetical protein